MGGRQASSIRIAHNDHLSLCSITCSCSLVCICAGWVGYCYRGALSCTKLFSHLLTDIPFESPKSFLHANSSLPNHCSMTSLSKCLKNGTVFLLSFLFAFLACFLPAYMHGIHSNAYAVRFFKQGLKVWFLICNENLLTEKASNAARLG